MQRGITCHVCHAVFGSEVSALQHYNATRCAVIGQQLEQQQLQQQQLLQKQEEEDRLRKQKMEEEDRLRRLKHEEEDRLRRLKHEEEDRLRKLKQLEEEAFARATPPVARTIITTTTTTMAMTMPAQEKQQQPQQLQGQDQEGGRKMLQDVLDQNKKYRPCSYAGHVSAGKGGGKALLVTDKWILFVRSVEVINAIKINDVTRVSQRVDLTSDKRYVCEIYYTGLGSPLLVPCPSKSELDVIVTLIQTTKSGK